MRVEMRAKRLLQAEVVHLSTCLTRVPRWNPRLFRAFTHQAACDFESSSHASDA
jgi:hypothetical protein